MKKLATVLGFFLFMTLYTVGLYFLWDWKYIEMGERIDSMISVDAQRDRTMEDMVELHMQTVVKIAAQEREIKKNSNFAERVVILWLEVVETSQTMVRLQEINKGFDSKAEYKKHQQLEKEEK